MQQMGPLHLCSQVTYQPRNRTECVGVDDPTTYQLGSVGIWVLLSLHVCNPCWKHVALTTERWSYSGLQTGSLCQRRLPFPFHMYLTHRLVLKLYDNRKGLQAVPPQGGFSREQTCLDL